MVASAPAYSELLESTVRHRRPANSELLESTVPQGKTAPLSQGDAILIEQHANKTDAQVEALQLSVCGATWWQSGVANKSNANATQLSDLPLLPLSVMHLCATR